MNNNVKISGTGLTREQLHQLVMAMPACVAVLDGPTHVFRLANPAYLQLIGKDQDIIGKSMAEILADARPEGFIEILDGVYQNGKPHNGQAVQIWLDRGNTGELEEIYVNFSYLPLMDAAGCCSGVLVHGSDVTEQIHMRQNLSEHKHDTMPVFNPDAEFQDNEQLFRIYAEAMPQMAFIADAAGNITYYNQRWYDYVGNMQDTEGWGWIQLPIHHPDDLPMTLDRWQESLRTGKPYEIEYRLRHHSGQYRWHLGLAEPVRNAHGRIEMWLGSNTDIHALKELEYQKEEFLGVASHELKTPLTSVRAYAHVLKKRLQDAGDDATVALVDNMNLQMDKLASLISDLLDATQIDQGKLPLEKEDFDFNGLVSDVLATVAKTAEKHKIEVSGLDGPKQVTADRGRLGQVITNFMTNAVKYSPRTKPIRVQVDGDDEEVRFSVRDSGIGISPQDRRQIFDRFYRVGGDFNQTYPGLGLGLFIASQIVRRHGGRIWAESNEGQGCVFNFTVPRQPCDQADPDLNA